MSSVSVLSSEQQVPFTTYDQIVETAFPQVVMMRKYRQVDARIQPELDSLRAGLLDLIESTGPAWLAPITHPEQPTREDVKRVLVVARQTPIWVCPIQCDLCGLSRPDACAISKEFGGTVASVILLSSKILKGTKKALLEGFQRAYAQIAYAKINGVRDWSIVRPAVQKTELTFAESFSQGTAMMKRCPQSFNEGDLGLLLKSGGLRNVPEAWKECGRRLVKPWSEVLPKACQNLLQNSVPNIAHLTVGKCDAWCSFLTCQSETYSTRIHRFGERWALFLSDSSCDGEKPTSNEVFARLFLEKIRKKPLGTEEELNFSICTKELYKNSAPPSQPHRGPYEFPKDAPEVVPAEAL